MLVNARSAAGRLILSSSGGTLHVIAAAGDLLPGLGDGIRYGGNFREPVYSSTGVAAYAVDLTKDPPPFPNLPPPSIASTIWSNSGGTSTLLVRQGDPVAQTAGSAVFGPPTGDTMVINDSGKIGFSTQLTGSPTGFSGILVSDTGGNRLVAHRGDPAPGFTSGEQLATGSLDELGINGQGDVAFFSAIQQVSDAAFLNAIYVEHAGSLHLVAHDGSPLPGLPAGVVLDRADSQPVINDRGEIAFAAEVKGPGVVFDNRFGVWSQGLGGLHLFTRDMDQAAGLDAGVLYDSLQIPSLNSRGQAMFQGDLTGPNIDSTNDHGLWAESITGELRLIARTGDVIAVGPGDTRTIRTLSISDYSSGNDDGRRSPISDRGEVAFQALFMDGSSGVFVSELVAVPEPTSVVLAAIACAFLNAAQFARPRGF